jgi:hypothetical protein
MDAENTERLLVQALRSVSAFAPGWTKAAVLRRVDDIVFFGAFHSKRVIPLDQRRRISRLAGDLLLEDGSSEAPAEYLHVLRALARRQPAWRAIPRLPGGARRATRLLSELDGLGGLSGEFIDTLRVRATSERQRFAVVRDRGGDRRSGEPTLKNSVLSMIVVLYCEAHAKPGGSEGGPLFRFANAIGELALGEREPFSPAAVRAEFRRMKPNVRRPPSLQYPTMK